VIEVTVFCSHIRPGVTLSGWRNVKIPKLTYFVHLFKFNPFSDLITASTWCLWQSASLYFAGKSSYAQMLIFHACSGGAELSEMDACGSLILLAARLFSESRIAPAAYILWQGKG